MVVRNVTILLMGLSVISGCLSASPFVVGGFNAARGGFESLAAGEDTGLANDITTAFPGTTFQFTSTLTPTFLSGINVLILGVGTGNTSAITPLSTAEQSALLNFVLAGGTALIFTDDDSFASNAPAANASLVSPFGVTATGLLSGDVDAPILNPTGPLTGPLTPVTDFTTLDPGFFTNTGAGTVLAEFNNNPGEAAIDYFAPGLLGQGSGAVVLFSDSDAMVAGEVLSTTNEDLILNAFPSTTTPEPSTLVLCAGALGAGIAFCRRTRRAPLAA